MRILIFSLCLLAAVQVSAQKTVGKVTNTYSKDFNGHKNKHYDFQGVGALGGSLKMEVQSIVFDFYDEIPGYVFLTDPATFTHMQLVRVELAVTNASKAELTLNTSAITLDQDGGDQHVVTSSSFMILAPDENPNSFPTKEAKLKPGEKAKGYLYFFLNDLASMDDLSISVEGLNDYDEIEKVITLKFKDIAH